MITRCRNKRLERDVVCRVHDKNKQRRSGNGGQQLVALDGESGEVRRTIAVERPITPGHHIRCYPPKATERYLLLNKRGVEFLDIKGQNSMRHNWLRAPCHYGAVPANGLLYTPSHQCFCYPGVLLDGFNAFTSRTSLQPPPSGERKRLFRGPAWGTDGGDGNKGEKVPDSG